MRFTFLLLMLQAFVVTHCLDAADVSGDRLKLAGENRSEIQRALREAPEDQQKGMKFLINHMPEWDLKSLSAEFLHKNARLAYETRSSYAWAKNVPEDIFLNNVLPYASINERRDDWRADFKNRCESIVKEATSASEAAALISQKLFNEIGVKYSRKRKKAD